jgi:hypothetical protein
MYACAMGSVRCRENVDLHTAAFDSVLSDFMRKKIMQEKRISRKFKLA